MAAFEFAHEFVVQTEKFDYRGPIPEEYNAGNQFYGADLCAYLETALEEYQLKVGFLDEDWGWFGEGEVGEDQIVSFYTYNHYDGDEPADRVGSNTWSIMVEQFQRFRRFGFIPGKKRIPVTSNLLQKIEAVLTVSGIKLLSSKQSSQPSFN